MNFLIQFKNKKKLFCKKLYFLLFGMIFFQNFLLFCQNYAEIPELSSRNILFRQYEQEVENANKIFMEGKNSFQNFYAYTCTKGDNIISLSARTCIRQETLATANNIENAQTSLDGKKILLPVKDGIFIAENPSSTLEIILKNQYENQLETAQKFLLFGKKYFFLADKKFTPQQRAFFLSPGFVPPLSTKIITSSFGNRISPISGKWKKHNGIDLAADYGSEIFACRGGKVLEIKKMDSIYGNCIILLHSGGFTSLYAHLSEILVEEGQEISAGKVIGKVGLTGLTTGPHLHFEIHQNGIAENPEKFYKSEKKSY